MLDERSVPTIRVVNLGLTTACYLIALAVIVAVAWPVLASIGVVGPDAVTLQWGAVRIRLAESDLGATFWYSPLVGAVSAAVALYILHHLRGLFRSIGGGDPFTDENAHRLRLIATALLVREGLQTVLSLWMGFVMSKIIAGGHLGDLGGVAGVSLDVGAALDLWSLGLGLMVLVIAEVFRIGTRMREDLEYTI